MSATAAGEPVEELNVRPLTIAPDEVAAFIAAVYDTHPHGKSFVPRWSGPFLKHLIFDHPDVTPDHALAAYMGDRLVGLIMAQPYAMHVGDKTLPGVFGSWLAITPEGAAQFAAIKLISELKRRLSERGSQFMVGIAYRSGPGVGLDFWERYMRVFPKEISKGRDLKYWARVLDSSALAGAVNDPLLKIGAQAARLRPVLQPKPNPHIRDFVRDDLARCQELLKAAPAQFRTAPTLWELLGAPSLSVGPQTLVLDKGSGAEGLAMFHILPMSYAGPLGVGIVDHLVSGTGAKDQGALLAATLWRLKQAGACLALLPQKPYIASASMLLAGFVPYAADFKIFLMPFTDSLPAEMPASYDLLVR